jgi:hypothetical protein
MSIKAFYVVGAVAAVMAVAGAVTVFAADPPATKAPAAPAATSAKPAPAKGQHAMVRVEAPSFAEIDSNHDGMISQAEFDAFRAAHKPEVRMQGPGGPEGRGFEGRGPGGWGGPPMMMMREHRFGGRGEGFGGMGGMDGARGEHIIDLLDANNDGKVSFDELVAPLKRHFNRMDANHDGFLSADELHKGHDKPEDGRRDGQMPPPSGQ